MGDLVLRPPLDRRLDEGSQAVAFVRPHDITLSREQVVGAAPATVVQVHATGPLVRLELECADDRQLIEVQIPRGRYRSLAIAAGDAVHFGFSRFQVYPSDTADASTAQPHPQLR